MELASMSVKGLASDQLDRVGTALGIGELHAVSRAKRTAALVGTCGRWGIHARQSTVLAQCRHDVN